MKELFSGTLIFVVVLIGSQSAPVSASQESGKEVPKGFSYPESPKTTELKNPIRTTSLSGTVADAAGFPIPRILVELVSRDWKRRLAAIFTDSEGTFAFATARKGKHYLKLSGPGFDSLMVRVIATKKAKAKRLKLFLNPST